MFLSVITDNDCEKKPKVVKLFEILSQHWMLWASREARRWPGWTGGVTL